MTSKKKKFKPHPWQPEIKVWKEKDLLYYDGPIAIGRVVEIPDSETLIPKGEFLFELAYHVGHDKNVLDPDGCIAVRWTKADLREMIDLMETTEKEFGLSTKEDSDKQQQEKEEKKDDRPEQQQQSSSNDFTYSRPDWFSNACG